jgi:(p)ppGpp synthase/HD superfamily hydrolase
MENPVQLTPPFTLALDYARQIHVSLRKGSQVPYMVHLLGVVSRVLGESGYVPFPVKEDMVIAALQKPSPSSAPCLLSSTDFGMVKRETIADALR